MELLRETFESRRHRELGADVIPISFVILLFTRFESQL